MFSKMTCLLLGAMLSLSVFARDITVATITADDDPEIVKLVLEVDSNNVLMAMRKDVYKSGRLITVITYHADDVLRKGAVMSQSGNREVVVLRTASNFSLSAGGQITLDYLFSGISGERRKKALSLRNNAGKWQIFNGNQLVSKMHFELNTKILVGAIGVKNIIFK